MTTKDKVIAIEALGGPLLEMLGNVLRMVPSRDRNDVALQRLLAFRLRIDGESATREYLMRNLRAMSQSRYHGRLYDFLSRETGLPPKDGFPPKGDPPESA